MTAVVIPQPNFIQSLAQGTQTARGLQQIAAAAQQQRQMQALGQQLGSGQDLPSTLAQLSLLSPAAAQQARRSLNLPFEQQQLAASAERDRAGVVKSQLDSAKLAKELQQPATAIAKELFDAGLRGVELQQATRAALAERQRLKNQRASRPGVQVNIGKDGQIPLNRSTQTEVQKSLFDTLGLADELAMVEELGDVSDLLTVQGRVTSSFAKGADLFGLDVLGSTGRVARESDLRQRVESVFNIFRRQITGAAAPMAELEEIRKNILNTDMSPTQFETALSNLREKTQRAARLRYRLLREGFVPGSEAGVKRLNALWKAGAKGDSAADRKNVFVSLVDSELERMKQDGRLESLGQEEARLAAEDAAYQRLINFGFE